MAFTLLAITLIIWGISFFVTIPGIIIGILAIVTGVLILLERHSTVLAR